MKEVDFERAKLLMDFIVSAQQHGPLYQKLASCAQAELRDMVEDQDEKPKVVTPAAGPENSLLVNPDGTQVPIRPKPPVLTPPEGLTEAGEAAWRKEQEQKFQTKAEPNPPRSVLNEPVDEPIERRI